MPFTGILIPLLFGLAFVLPAIWLWRIDRRLTALVPALVALLLVGVTIGIYLDGRNQRQAAYDLDLLTSGLEQDDLYTDASLRDNEETLFLFSTASQALAAGLPWRPDTTGRTEAVLRRMAAWTARTGNVPQWRGGSDWDHEVFFLAHAGIVLGQYQLATNDETYAAQFRRIGRYLGERLHRGHYKHLGSHPNESLLRPADNAAAIYALSLYDAYYGEDLATETRREWTGYIDKELHFAESRLPCAAFTVTNRCSIEPSAAATGLYIAYRAAAAPEEVENDIPYREWLHYFKRFSGNPFRLRIRPNMRTGEVARLCDAGLAPLECGRYEEAIGLWAAAEYGGGYTYFRLFSRYVFQRWFGDAPDYGSMRPARRVKALTELALRTIGEAR